MKMYARVTGSVPGPPAPPLRWWQWVPPWCVPRPAVPTRTAWSSYRVPCLMETSGYRTTNTSTMVWGGPWPVGLEPERVIVESEAGEMLFWFDLDVQHRRFGPTDTLQVPPGGITFRLS